MVVIIPYFFPFKIGHFIQLAMSKKTISNRPWHGASGAPRHRVKSWQHRLADDEAQEDQQHPETSGNKTVEQRDLRGYYRSTVTLKNT